MREIKLFHVVSQGKWKINVKKHWYLFVHLLSQSTPKEPPKTGFVPIVAPTKKIVCTFKV